MLKLGMTWYDWLMVRSWGGNLTSWRWCPRKNICRQFIRRTICGKSMEIMITNNSDFSIYKSWWLLWKGKCIDNWNFFLGDVFTGTPFVYHICRVCKYWSNWGSRVVRIIIWISWLSKQTFSEAMEDKLEPSAAVFHQITHGVTRFRFWPIFLFTVTQLFTPHL